MMNGTFMETLLDGVEVEWKALNHLVNTITAPAKVKREVYRETGEVPIIDQGFDYIAGYTDEKISVVESDNYVIFGDHSENIKFVNFSFIQGADGLKILKPKRDNAKFIYYAFLNYYQKELNYKRHWSSARETLIPIPCPENPEKSLEIQSEIVRILDTFTELTAELTAELKARKKQYNYYRDMLLSFKDGEVEWKALGEIGEFIRGKRFVKTDIISEGVPCIHYGEMYTHYNIWADEAKSYISEELASKLRKAKYGDVVFVAAGETIEDIGRGTAWLSNEDVVIHDACFFYKSSLNPKYVAYYTRTKFFHDQIKKSISSGKISAINAKGFEKVIIPVHSPEKQARIVSILDKFDALTSSITEGLPHEIELRQKQYEYYRNMLLSFPREEAK